MFLLGPKPAEERRIRIPTPAERWPAYGGELQSKCKLQTRGVRSRKEKERERGDDCVLEKGGGTPPYIGQGGGASSSPPPCGTKPQRGDCVGQGGSGPLPWHQAQGGNSP